MSLRSGRERSIARDQEIAAAEYCRRQYGRVLPGNAEFHELRIAIARGYGTKPERFSDQCQIGKAMLGLPREVPTRLVDCVLGRKDGVPASASQLDQCSGDASVEIGGTEQYVRIEEKPHDATL